MPYNTRRKSLSLPALGIQLPSASRAHRHSPSKSSTTSEILPPPSKKAKRSHSSTVSSPVTPARPRSSTASSSKSVTFAERPKSSGRAAYDNTPPPSPGADSSTKLDLDGVNDDIVVGVLEQLEKTGNRPHLIKELATVLSTTSDAVANSANPAALLSSRLAAYIKRPNWTSSSPCPLGKELIPIHPRKVYYFLTTLPRQDFPADAPGFPSFTPSAGGKGGKRIISPSLSNASVDEDAEERKRHTLSPSPEVDLSPPETDLPADGCHDDITPPIPGVSFSSRSSLAREGSSGSSSDSMNLAHNQRSASPPLEIDEKEFTQTARGMRERGLSMDDFNIQQSKEVDEKVSEETEEEKAKNHIETVVTLFGEDHQAVQARGAIGLMSSPMVQPLRLRHSTPAKGESSSDLDRDGLMPILGDQGLGAGFSWDIAKPENTDLAELDALFGEF